jgi:hypothetical protein
MTETSEVGLAPAARRALEKQAVGLDAEEKAQAAANATVLPGPLKAAFASGSVEVAGLRVRRFVHFDWVIMERLGSPLVKHLQRVAGGSRRKTSFTDEQGYEMVFQFTRPVQEVELLLEKHGVAGFRKLAKLEIGYQLGPIEVMLLAKAVETEFARAISTPVKYSGKSAESSETVFTTPPATPGAKTDSDGGSIISAA